MFEKKKPLIILTGPTAVGKTALSVQLAKAVNGEIISADSMQVYKYMDIGSAKIKSSEMEGVPHYMIDFLEPTEEFSVTVFQKYAKQYIREIHDRGHIPILAGGTGFYIQSVLYDIDFIKTETNHDYRQYLEELSKEKGAEYLHEMLKKQDIKSAEAIHPNNIKRVIRALEYFQLTGLPISDHNEEESKKESPYHSCYFVLDDKREHLYQRIDRRVLQMIEDGLEEEVARLLSMNCKREDTAMQGLGYKEMIDYLTGEISLEQAIYLIQRNTRHFAKRQLTWFRREKEVIWVKNEEQPLAFMLDYLKKEELLT